MGLFGKSEAELKQIASNLDYRLTELDNDKSTLKSAQSNYEQEKKLLEDAKAQFEIDREAFREEVKTVHEAIASEKAELEKRRIEIAKREAEAKAKFVEKQREAFKESIEKRIAELDARQKELDGLEGRVAAKLKDLHTEEGKIASRELAVTEREQKADSGFADKAKALADEAARQHQANQAEADRLRKLADVIAEDRQRLEGTKANLVQREQSIIASEQKRDAGFADERAALDVELRDNRATMESEIAAVRKQKLSAFEDESGKLKTKRLEETTKAEQAERDRIRAEIAKERDAWTKLQEEARKKLEVERTELETQKSALSALRSELEGRKTELEANERTLERKDQRLEQQWQKRNTQLDDATEAGVEERRKSFEASETASKAEIDRLRDGLRIQAELVGAFEQLKRQLGDRDPAEILRDLNSKSDELKRLREELATRPTEEMRERYQALELEAKNQKARADGVKRQNEENTAAVAEVAELRLQNSKINAEKKSLAQNASIFEGAAKVSEEARNAAEAELNRLRAAYKRPVEVAARYKEIEMPHIKADKLTQPTKNDAIDENTWLTEIGNACDRHGVHFHPRILKAFHTALKTAEWSPITILAGVSGTGKSELPKLYSHFGGLMFESLAVQPNWDSQESMLGFFNSIDNKFAAKPVLNFLAQSQQSGNETSEERIKRWKEMAPGQLSLDPNKKEDKELIEALQQSDYPGLKDFVCMILLDEMNIAYPELYFAEFLSKLEQRRGKRTDLPYLPVEIGAGMPHYKLPLGRNVLWTGTMNQDETTKSLSDKVLDRSIIIYFPRPTKLQRRPKLRPLDENNRGIPLHRATWWSWLSLVPDPDNPKQQIPGSDLDETIIAPFKDFLETMNGYLGVVGRALGHRVWQSVEYYMVNYPDVRAARKANDNDALKKAMHDAFEDQLVQKVMPKLRGIDTLDRSSGKTECLDKILDQITNGIGGEPFNLAEDFNLACKLGYGQFIWQSANYLKDEEKAEAVEVPTSDTAQVDVKPLSKAKNKSGK